MDMEKLYSELILYHNKYPRNFSPLENKTNECKGHNPLCGDQYEIFLQIDQENIEKIHFLGMGCAISKASISLMIELLENKPIEKALETIQQFKNMILYETENDIEFKKLKVFEGIKKIPSRKKCCLIGWYILDCALKKEKKINLNEE